MSVVIRRFSDADIPHLVRILALNDQFSYPAVEGPDAMKRAARCTATVSLVSEGRPAPTGFCRAFYDGSRAFIYLLSVHPRYQRRTVGSQLVMAAERELRFRGAPTVSVSATEASAGFWERQGFRRLPVFLMLKDLSARPRELPI